MLIYHHRNSGRGGLKVSLMTSRPQRAHHCFQPKWGGAVCFRELSIHVLKLWGGINNDKSRLLLHQAPHLCAAWGNSWGGLKADWDTAGAAAKESLKVEGGTARAGER